MDYTDKDFVNLFSQVIKALPVETKQADGISLVNVFNLFLDNPDYRKEIDMLNNKYFKMAAEKLKGNE